MTTRCNAPAPTPRGRVAVVGAGIAGVAAALALRRRGYDAVVYEAQRAAEVPHAGITLSAAALAALRRIDAQVADAAIAAGDVITTIVLRDLNGKPLAETRTGGSLDTDKAEPTLCLRWSELWRILADALPADALQFGHALEDFTDNSVGAHLTAEASRTVSGAPPVLAVFSHRDTFGQAAVPAAVIVGADGLRSKVRACAISFATCPADRASALTAQVRRLLFGAEPPPCDAGATVWRGVIDSRAAPPGLCPHGAFVCCHAPDGRTLTIMSLGTGGSTLHDGSLSWVASLPSAVPPSGEAAPGNLAEAFVDLKQPASAEARTLAYLTHTPAMSLAEAAAAPLVADRVRAAFADFSDMPALLAATPAGEIVERRLFYRATPDAAYCEDDDDELRHCNGVATLIGDAASMRLPALGLGACLSLESAAELGDALGALPAGAGAAGIAAALRSFEESQHRRARRAARAALDEARRVAAAPVATIPAPGTGFQGWLLGNARRGKAV